MKINRRFLTLVITGLIPALLVSCHTPDPFDIWVTDLEGNPLGSVLVVGVSDDHGGALGTMYYNPASYLTGIDGSVEVAGSNKGRSGEFYLSDYFPLNAWFIPDYTYTLTPTPAKLSSLKTMEGSALKFAADGIVSFSSGDYQYFDMSGNVVTTVTALYPKPTIDIFYFGRNVWIRSSSTRFSLINLSNPSAPTVTSLPSQPVNGAIVAASKTCLLTQNGYRSNPKLYRLFNDSLLFASEIKIFGNTLDGATISGSNLYLAYSYNWHVFDISNPLTPTQVSVHSEQGNIKFQDSLMIVRQWTGSSIPCKYNIYSFNEVGKAILQEAIETPTPLELLSDNNHALLRNEGNKRGYFIAERTAGTAVFQHRGFSLNRFSSFCYPRALFGKELFALE